MGLIDLCSCGLTGTVKFTDRIPPNRMISAVLAQNPVKNSDIFPVPRNPSRRLCPGAAVEVAKMVSYAASRTTSPNGISSVAANVSVPRGDAN